MEKNSKQSNEKFVCHLEKSSATVSSWPKWKQDILGASITIKENNNKSSQSTMKHRKK